MLFNCRQALQSHASSLTAKISLLAPLRRMVQALGSLHSMTKVKYSSPIFFTSNRPAPVPTSSSRSSSVLLAIRAPHALKNKNNPNLICLTMIHQALKNMKICSVPCNTVVVCLSDTADCSDVCFHQIVLSQIYRERAQNKSKSPVLTSPLLTHDCASAHLYPRCPSL